MAEPRDATGTPIRELFAESDQAMSERIARLERQNAELRQMLRQQAFCIGINAAQIGRLSQRVAELEQVRKGDLRLSEVIGGIEARLKWIQLGGEMP